jgi:hypothetical protein
MRKGPLGIRTGPRSLGVNSIRYEQIATERNRHLAPQDRRHRAAQPSPPFRIVRERADVEESRFFRRANCELEACGAGRRERWGDLFPSTGRRLNRQ